LVFLIEQVAHNDKDGGQQTDDEIKSVAAHVEVPSLEQL